MRTRDQFNGPVDVGAPRTAIGARGKRVDLVKLALGQRALLWCILARLIIEIGFFTIGAASPGSGVPIGIYVGLLLLSWVVTIVFIVRVATAYGYHPVMAVLGGLISLLACFGLIALLLLNQRVTQTLTRAGAKVGLMGVSSAELHKLREGVCPGCGYSVHGLVSPICPECGGVLTRRM